MSKKKSKIKKLTDEEYNNYIMSLKDENPPKIVRDYYKESWKYLQTIDYFL